MMRHKLPIRIDGDTAYVDLPNGMVATIDAPDVERVASYSWTAAAGDTTYYAHARSREVAGPPRIYLHRLILNAPKGVSVDHIDRDGLNCRRSNLRLATAAQNCWNQGVRVSNTSGFKGVSWRADRQKWQAQIRVNRERIFLGAFETAEKAGAAYAAAARRYHGEFARVSWPSPKSHPATGEKEGRS